ncbi:MAG: DUF480 domain-containing protein [Pseudomonadota bacterium]
MANSIDDAAVRVLGSLMEKALATPEYYPLSLNALTAACNQKSSREPVVAYDEATVQAAADDLASRELVYESRVGRVSKFEERFSQLHSLVPRETAVLCVLLLRGAQTIGEIRTRTSRLYAFQSLEEAAESMGTLEALGVAARLARLPGHKESRYAHLLSGAPETAAPAAAPAPPPESTESAENVRRMEKLEATVAALEEEMAALKRAFLEFRKQFE